MKQYGWKKALTALVCAGAVLTLAACSSGSSDTGNSTSSGGAQTQEVNTADTGGETADATTYTFETELTYMDDVVGGGISGAAAGVNMIVESSDASNGFYVGSTHSTNCIITFKVTSDQDASATLRLLVGSELGAMDMSPTSFIISVNGTPLTYSTFSIPAEAKQTGKTFTQFNVGDIDLTSGENTITFQVGPNEYCNGGPGGPLFDAIKLTSTASLTMEEHPENLE